MVLSDAERQQSYKERMADKGYTRFTAWIPEKYRDDVNEFILELKRKEDENNRTNGTE